MPLLVYFDFLFGPCLSKVGEGVVRNTAAQLRVLATGPV